MAAALAEVTSAISTVCAPSEGRSGDRRSQGDDEGTELVISELRTSTSGGCGDMVLSLSARGGTPPGHCCKELKTKGLQIGQFVSD